MESENTQLELLKERIPFNQRKYGNVETYGKTLTRLLEDSKYIALSLRYPYKDYSTLELPKKYYNWQLRCCEELIKLIGSANVKSYSENGISWTKDSGYLTDSLVSEIEPMVGAVGSE